MVQDPPHGGLSAVGAVDAPSSRRLPSADDSALIAAVRKGDLRAATRFHDRLRPQVERTVRRLLGPGDPDGEDVTQVAMMELVHSIDRFRGDCALDGWAAAVAAHVVWKQIRRRRMERRVFSGLEEGDTEVAVGVDDEAAAGARGLLRRIVGHLQTMGEDRAWAFVLHDVLGHDLKEIAAITGASVPAVQSRLFRGRKELLGHIEGDPELREFTQAWAEKE
jgi:RNA polymerase sigma factor (sigma-70 family)